MVICLTAYNNNHSNSSIVLKKSKNVRVKENMSGLYGDIQPYFWSTTGYESLAITM